MNVRYILGRAGVGKTHKIYEEIRDELKTDSTNKLVLLVPEQFTLEGEADLISKMGLDGIMRLEVLSFSRIAFKVLNEVGGITKKSINELGKVMILRKLFEENLQELDVFKKGFNHEGFLTNFCELISEFKRSGITTIELKARIDSLEKDNMLKRKLQDILLIYEKFDEYLEDRYTDDDDNLNLAIEKIKQSNYFDGAEIWIDEFSTFSTQEYKLIEQLISKSKQVNITLTLDLKTNTRDYDVFDATLNTFNRISDIAKANNIKETIIIKNREYNNKVEEILHFEREFFSYPYNKYNKPQNINIFSGLNQYTEIENTAINIISLARNKQYRWRDIAVVCNSLDIYTPTIKRVFNEYGIPYFIDERRDIMSNPIIKFLLSSLEIMSRNFRYEDIFKCIKTGFTNLTKYEYEKLENHVLQFGIKGSTWLSDFDYIEYKDEEKNKKSIEQAEEINEIRTKFITPFINLKSKLKSKNNVLDTTKSIFEFLIEMNLEEKINILISKHKEKGNLDYVNENTQIWNTIIEVFDQLVEILDDSNISLKEYIKILESGFSNYEIGVIPPTMDQVLVGNLERSKSHDLKALFVVGVNDGILPSGFNDGGIILDDEKIIMQKSGIELYTDNATKVKEEKLSIYSSFVKPSDDLYISYALGDLEGKALRPSTIIDRLKKVFDIDIESDITSSRETMLKLISRPSSTFKYLIENLRMNLDKLNEDSKEQMDEIWWDVYDFYYNNDNWNEKRNIAIDGLFHSNQEDTINAKYTTDLYGEPLRSSISRLETFVNCPFSHFIRYGLKPEERKEYSIKMPDIGILFHNSIEMFSKELSLENLAWNDIDRTKSDEIVDKVLDKMVENFQSGVFVSTYRYKYLVNKLKRVSKRALWVLTEHLKVGEFEPLRHELFFGEDSNSEVPPIILQLPNGEEIKIEGIIDRVDILNDGEKSYLKVIDYKSGNREFSLSDAYYGLQIQLIVYMDAVLSNTDKLVKNEAHPAGAFYFKIDDPIVNTDEDDAKAIEEKIHGELKMNGLVLNDIKVIKALDNELATAIKDEDDKSKKSNVIPVTLKKDGSPSSYSTVYDEKDFKNIMIHVRGLIKDIATEILRGKIKIEPCKNGKQTPCEYCDFHSICQFDASFDDNGYRVLKKVKDEEILEKINQEDKE